MDRKCILVCAGDMNLTQLTLGEQEDVVAVDGGFLYCRFLGIEPRLVIGDFDSIAEEQKEELERFEKQYPDRIIRLQPQKDDTDTIAAVKEALKLGYRQFRLYAAMGGRIEHTLANMQTLLYLKEHGAEGYLMDADCMVFVIREEEVFLQKDLEGYLSLFAMNGQAEGVVIRNMKYPLEDAVIKESFPIGISNEFIGKQALISVKKGSLLAIVRWMEEGGNGA